MFVLAVVLAKNEEQSLLRHETSIRAAVCKLLGNDDFTHAITYSTNSRKQVHKRFLDMESAVAEALR